MGLINGTNSGWFQIHLSNAKTGHPIRSYPSQEWRGLEVAEKAHNCLSNMWLEVSMNVYTVYIYIMYNRLQNYTLSKNSSNKHITSKIITRWAQASKLYLQTGHRPKFNCLGPFLAQGWQHQPISTINLAEQRTNQWHRWNKIQCKCVKQTSTDHWNLRKL